MGFWDAVKSIATSAKCMTGWHAGEYSHMEGKPECYLEKVCPDCNEYVTKKNHKFTEWEYINSTYSKSCDSIKKCIYCEHKEQKVIHQYVDRGKDSSCRIIERCRRCEHERLGTVSHNWVTIMGHELKVQGKRKCRDCGIVE